MLERVTLLDGRELRTMIRPDGLGQHYIVVDGELIFVHKDKHGKWKQGESK